MAARPGSRRRSRRPAIRYDWTRWTAELAIAGRRLLRDPRPRDGRAGRAQPFRATNWNPNGYGCNVMHRVSVRVGQLGRGCRSRLDLAIGGKDYTGGSITMPPGGFRSRIEPDEKNASSLLRPPGFSSRPPRSRKAPARWPCGAFDAGARDRRRDPRHQGLSRGECRDAPRHGHRLHAGCGCRLRAQHDPASSGRHRHGEGRARNSGGTSRSANGRRTSSASRNARSPKCGHG